LIWSNAVEQVMLGGGCFWCVEAAIKALRGVAKVESGYSGGSIQHPTYEQVCSETTGHAEVIRVTFDPNELSFENLLRVFFQIHDPTTPNRQGADIGTQYRSAVFFFSPEQEQVAQRTKAELEKSGLWGGKPFVTQIEQAGEFYPAEEYHQDYFARNPSQPYCLAVIPPKLAKLRKEF
jgi:peptide-methionine (S)-S-oxide reductase